jgi:hypothetical protein
MIWFVALELLLPLWRDNLLCFDCSYCCVLVDDLLRWKEILMCFFFCVEGALLLLWLLLLEFLLRFELWLQCFFVVLCWKKSHSSMEVAIASALKVLLLLRVCFARRTTCCVFIKEDMFYCCTYAFFFLPSSLILLVKNQHTKQNSPYSDTNANSQVEQEKVSNSFAILAWDQMT